MLLAFARATRYSDAWLQQRIKDAPVEDLLALRAHKELHHRLPFHATPTLHDQAVVGLVGMFAALEPRRPAEPLQDRAGRFPGRHKEIAQDMVGEQMRILLEPLNEKLFPDEIRERRLMDGQRNTHCFLAAPGFPRLRCTRASSTLDLMWLSIASVSPVVAGESARRSSRFSAIWSFSALRANASAKIMSRSLIMACVNQYVLYEQRGFTDRWALKSWLELAELEQAYSMTSCWYFAASPSRLSSGFLRHATHNVKQSGCVRNMAYKRSSTSFAFACKRCVRMTQWNTRKPNRTMPLP